MTTTPCTRASVIVWALELEEAAPDLQAGGGLRDREPVVGRQPAELVEREPAEHRQERGDPAERSEQREEPRRTPARRPRTRPSPGDSSRLSTSVRRSRRATPAPAPGGAASASSPASRAGPARVRTASRRASRRVAQVLGLCSAQERERPLARAAAGDVHLQLGEPEQPGHERLADVDPLQPVDADPAATAGTRPRCRPAARRPRSSTSSAATRRRRTPRRRPAARAGPRRSARGRRVGCRPTSRRPPRRRAMKLRTRGVSGDSRLKGRSGSLTARLPAPRRGDVSRSRSRAASSAGSPGMRALVPGLAVCRCTLAILNSCSSGPACTSTYCMRP